MGSDDMEPIRGIPEAKQPNRTRRACECIRRRRWEIVLVSEIRSDSYGTLWMGEGGSQIVIVYSKKICILMRGNMMRGWIESRQKVEHGERTTM